MRLGNRRSCVSQAESEHELYRRSQQGSQERLETPMMLRHSAGLAPSCVCSAPSFCRPRAPHDKTQSRCSAHSAVLLSIFQRADMKPRARGLSDYDVPMPFTVWHTYPREIHSEIPDLSAADQTRELRLSCLQHQNTGKLLQTEQVSMVITHTIIQCFSRICTISDFDCSFARFFDGKGHVQCIT